MTPPREPNVDFAMISGMTTTLELTDEACQLAENIARDANRSVGQVVSELGLL